MSWTHDVYSFKSTPSDTQQIIYLYTHLINLRRHKTGVTHEYLLRNYNKINFTSDP